MNSFSVNNNTCNYSCGGRRYSSDDISIHDSLACWRIVDPCQDSSKIREKIWDALYDKHPEDFGNYARDFSGSPAQNEAMLQFFKKQDNPKDFVNKLLNPPAPEKAGQKTAEPKNGWAANPLDAQTERFRQTFNIGKVPFLKIEKIDIPSGWLYGNGVSGTLFYNGSMGIAQAELQYFGKLSPLKAVPIVSTIFPAFTTAGLYRKDLFSGDPQLAGLAADQVMLQTTKGVIAGGVSTFAGGLILSSTEGLLPGAVCFLLASAAWYGLDKLEEISGLNSIDMRKAPFQINTELANHGMHLIKLDSADLFTYFNDQVISDPAQEKTYTYGQFMAYFLRSIPEDKKAQIRELGIGEINIPAMSDFTPELFNAALIAASRFRTTTESSGPITVRFFHSLNASAINASKSELPAMSGEESGYIIKATSEDSNGSKVQRLYWMDQPAKNNILPQHK